MSYKLRALLAFAVALVAVVVRLKPKAPAECDLELQLVAESARMVAGFRAVESSESSPLFLDPFAAILEGEERVKEAEEQQQKAPTSSGRKYLVDAISVRTKWIDDQLLACLETNTKSTNSPPKPSGKQDLGVESAVAYLNTLGYKTSTTIATNPEGVCEGGSTSTSTSTNIKVQQHDDSTSPKDGTTIDSKVQSLNHHPSQVVMMGSGMDTRPWRLTLPTDINWFEFDLQQVLGLKAALLSASGAEIPRCNTGWRGWFGHRCEFSPCTLPSNWTMMGAGANQEAAVEGLLEQNSGGAVAESLGLGLGLGRTSTPLAARSWKGIAANLTGNDWTRELLRAGYRPFRRTVWVLEGFLTYFDSETGGRILKQMADVSAPGSVMLAVCFSTEGIASGSHAAGIASTWKFSLPSDPAEVKKILERFGWRLEYSVAPAVVAKAMGIAENEQRPGGADRHTLFIMATRI